MGQSSPVAVPGVRGIVRIFAVDGAACGTDQGGDARVLGQRRCARPRDREWLACAPTPVGGIDHVIALSSHAAVRDNGEVWTWLDGGAPEANRAYPRDRRLAERDFPCALADAAVTCFADKPACGAAISFGGDKPVDKPKKPKKPKQKPKQKPKRPEPPPVPASVAFALPAGKVGHLAFATGTCVQTATKRFDCVDVDHACKVERPWPALVTVEQISGACARLTNGSVRCGASGGPRRARGRQRDQCDHDRRDRDARLCTGLPRITRVLCWEGTSAATPIAF